MNLHVTTTGQSDFPDLPRNLLKKAIAPVGSAAGLPNWLYNSPQAVEAEKSFIFAPGWTGIGFVSDVPEKGDVKPLTFLGEPIVLVRDREGEVRVFQNVCRHRGVVLVKTAHNSTGLLRCPYHAWCYSLKGELKQTPHAGGPGIHEHEALRKPELGLVEIRCHVFLGVVFVNLSGDAPPFEQVFATLAARWNDFDRPLYHSRQDSSFSLTVQTNWKLAVDNYCESYHLPFVHPGLNAYSRLEDHENILGDGPWSGQLTRMYNPPMGSGGRSFDPFPGLSTRWDTTGEYLAAYPNVLFGVHKDHTFAIILEPVSNATTIEHVEIFYASPEMTGPQWQEMREKNTGLWKGIFIEDIDVVESMQKGRTASGFDGGHFSPVMDESTHHFHTWIARTLLEGGTGEPSHA